MKNLCRLLAAFTVLSASARAEDYANGYEYGNDDQAAAEAYYGNDDQVQAYQQEKYANGFDVNNNAELTQGDDYIKYWTDYALLPKRCIV